MMPTKKYRVLNPRGILAGRHILRMGDKRWYVGDVYEVPSGGSTKFDVKRLLDQGFIQPLGSGAFGAGAMDEDREEVTDG